MTIKYRYPTKNGFIETLSLDTIPQGVPYTTLQIDDIPIYDSNEAALLSVAKGREIAESMLLSLNAKVKEHTRSTGTKIGKSLRISHRNLRESLELGDLDEAIVEIQIIVNSGQVDSFLSIYADALLQIDAFLNS